MKNLEKDSNIEKILGFKFPIFWNIWSIEPGFAELLIHKILTERPKTVVDLGSGNSTLIMAMILKKLGYIHKIYSVDSEKKFLEETKNRLLAEGLITGKEIQLIHAPIKNIKINQVIYKWYDFSNAKINEKIDLLIVDGPPGNLGKNIRYPAFHFFKEKMSENYSILLDDYNRPDEKEIVKLWESEESKLRLIKRLGTERGIAEIIKRD